MHNITNLLYSNITNFKTDSQKKEVALINTFSIIGIVTLLTFGVQNITGKMQVIGTIEIVFGIILILNLILLFVIRLAWIPISKLIIMLAVGIPLFALLIQGGIEGTGLFWYFTFPVLSFLLWNRKHALTLIFALVLGVVLVFLLSQHGTFNLFYSAMTLRQLLISLLVVTFLLYIFKDITEEQQKKLQDQQVTLEKTTTNLTVLLAKSQQSESDLKKRSVELEEAKKAALNILEDIEQEKNKLTEKEKELEEAQHIGHFGNFVWNLKTNVVFWSDEAFKIHGFKPTSNHIPPPIGEYFSVIFPEDLSGAKQSIQNATKTTNDHQYVYRIIMPDKTIRWVKVLSKLVLDQNHNPKILKGTFQDVTHEKEVDKMKTEFISLASHQLRTPLSAMKWFSEMLLNGDVGTLNSDQKDYIKNIYDSNKKMVDLVNSLLNISRIESGRLIITPEPTSIAKLVDQIVTEIKPTAQAKNQHLVVKVDSRIPKIDLDPKLIREVYVNLLINAIKYTPENGKIHLVVTKVKNKLISQISDNGIGIPANQQARIFQKFFRGDNAIKTEADGNGLGLYLVKSVIDSSGGTISFKSQENKGTTFEFTLPTSSMLKKPGKVISN